MLTRKAIHGTMTDRLVKMNFDPCLLAFSKPETRFTAETEDGVVDSLKHLIFHENFIKPWSSEHILATLLTKAF